MTEGRKNLIKGINRQVIEISQTQCEYFERVVFFIKPEFSAVSDGDLRERASAIAQSAGIPPASRLKRIKMIQIIKLSAAACAGAAVSVAVFLVSNI